MHHSSRTFPAPKLPLMRRLLIVVLLGVGCCFAFRAATTTLQASPSPEFVWKNIEDLQPGELVVAREEHGTRVSLRPVKEVYRRTSYHLRHLTFRDQSGQQQVFSTTDEHPFWSVTENSFVNAGLLPIGHQVTGPDGALQTLVQTQREDHPEGVSVFNFQVDDYHTYFVSAHGRRGAPVLVHNAEYPVIPDEVWANQQLPKQVTPTGSPQIVESLKPSTRGADPYRKIAEYDEYGRLRKITDYTDHAEPGIHPNPHYHLFGPDGSRIRNPSDGSFIFPGG